MKLVEFAPMLVLSVLVMPPTGLGSEVVFPNAYSATEAPTDSAGPLASFSSVGFEYLMAGSQFTAIPVGSQVTAIGFRLDAAAPTGPGSAIVYSDYSIRLSTCLQPIGSLSSVFANNIGPDVVTVRSGPMTIPQNAMSGGASPNPFYFISFDTPYTYKGGDLLLTLNYAGTGNSGLFADVDAIAVGPLLDTAVEGGYVHYFNGPVVSFVVVPEPSALLLLGLSLACIAFRRKNPFVRLSPS